MNVSLIISLHGTIAECWRTKKIKGGRREHFNFVTSINYYTSYSITRTC